MAKTPRTRHSKSRRKPVTIDLEADAVGRDSDDTAGNEAPSEITDDTGPAADALSKGADETDSNAAESEASQPTGELGTGQEDSPQMADTDMNEPSETVEDPPSGEPASDDAAYAAYAGEGGDGGHDGENGEPQDGTPEEPGEGAPEAREPRRSGGVGRALIAGIAGGVVALAIGGGLQWANILPAPGGAGSNAAVADLRQQFSALKTQVSQMSQSGTADASGEQISQLRAQLGQLQETVSNLQSAPGSGSGGQSNGGPAQDLSQLQNTAQNASQAAQSNAQKLEQLSGQVAQLAQQAGSGNESAKMALIVAASALKLAVENGEPFASELQNYESVAPDGSLVEPLKPYAEEGIPTNVELSNQVSQVASRIASSTGQVPQNAGIMDRLLAGARSAVKVRPVGEPQGDSPGAIAARMEAAVQRGDYAKALQEYKTLPPEAQKVASDFAEKLQARQAADQIVEKALSSALKSA